ncbi:MAG: LemA family protein [Solirubrobacterales bacterium]
MLIAIAIVGGLLLVAAAFVWIIYNRLVGLRQNVDNSFSQIDVALKRRHDLIPNLVETVRGYANHEAKTLESVTNARANAMATNPTDDHGQSEASLAGSLHRLLAVAENYPELKANKNFLELQSDLADTEDQIAITRRVYNDTVETYNTQVQVFPAVLVANGFGFDAREFFDAPAEAEVVPQVSYST